MRPTNKISICMIVKDEEKLIGELLRHVMPLIPQVVIVDTGSQDRTVLIARRAGATVLHCDLHHSFSVPRNYGLSQVRSTWAFQLDADETPSDYLLQWVVQFVEGQACASYDAAQVCRWNTIDGRPVWSRESEWHTRVFRSYFKYVGAIHERIVGARRIAKAPADFLLLHEKTEARQQKQNAFYREWQL